MAAGVRRTVGVALVVAAVAVVLIALAAVVVLRSSGSEGFAGAASELCDDARRQIEKLGSPTKGGLDALLARVEIGESLVADLEELEPPEGLEQEAEALVFSLRNYYASLRLAYEALRDNERSALGAIEESSQKSLDAAEGAAVAVGATGCADRPRGT